MRILFLTHRVPYAPNRGDRIRAFHALRFMTERADVDLIALAHDDFEVQQADTLRGQAASVRVARVPRMKNLVRSVPALLTCTPLTHVLLHSPQVSRAIAEACADRQPDVVIAYCSSMAQFAIRPPLARVPLVLDLVDVDSEKWREMARSAIRPLRPIYNREARTLSAFEAEAAKRAHSTLVVNEREAVLARRIAPQANVVVAPVGVDIDYFRPPGGPASDPRVVFCGVLDYAPNEQGVLWFIQNAWPMIRRRRPDAKLVVVGANPTRRLVRAGRRDQSVEIVGTVPDIRTHLWSAAVGIAPLSLARGVQTKVFELIAAGLPAVITTQVAEGLPSALRPGCSVAGDAETFASATLALLELTPHARRAIAGRAQLAELGWNRGLTALWKEVATAATSSADEVGVAAAV